MLLNKFVIFHTIRKVFQQCSITPFVDRHLLTHIVNHIVCGGVLMRLGFLHLFILRIHPSRSEDNKQGDGRNSESQALKVGKQLGRLFIPHTQAFIRRKRIIALRKLHNRNRHIVNKLTSQQGEGRKPQATPHSACQLINLSILLAPIIVI